MSDPETPEPFGQRARTMSTPTREWLEKHRDGDEMPLAGCVAKGPRAGDACPDCGKPMVFDAGEDMSRANPGQAACVFCSDCGMEYPVE